MTAKATNFLAFVGISESYMYPLTLYLDYVLTILEITLLIATHDLFAVI